MRMANFIVKDAIVAELQATTRDDAIREVVESLIASGQLTSDDREDVVKAILRREALGTTGIGHHIAIPHTRFPRVPHLFGTMAISKAGIPFESIDGEPAHVLVMIISPPDRPGDHLRALENVAKAMQNECYVTSLRAATTADEVWDLLQAGDGAMP